MLPDNAPVFHKYEDNPKKIIDLLETNHGDVEQYVKHFFHMSEIEVLSRTMSVLNRKENFGLRQQWDEIIASFEEAKVLLARRQALEIVSLFKPDVEDMDISKFTTYARFWLAAHTAADTTRAKRQASFEPAKGEADELAQAVHEMDAISLPSGKDLLGKP